MQFRLLGPVEVEAGGAVLALPRRQERCLLAVLLLASGRVVSYHRLTELLWDGTPPARARRTIHSHVARLRAALAQADAAKHGVVLATAGSGYRIHLDDPEMVDANRFRALREHASAAGSRSTAVELLRAALDLWTGDALEGTATDRQREYLCAELEEERMAAFEELVAGSLELGREQSILPELAAAATANPEREHLVELHMLTLYRLGRRAEALAAYGHARAHLAEELGLDPGPALTRVHQAILRDEAPPIRTTAPPSHDSSDATTPRQLPADVAGFTGRATAIAALDARLPDPDDGGSRPPAITLITGTAGVGKTALAVHWSHRVAARFPDAQLYLDLRGFGPDPAVLGPAEAVRILLDALSVPASRVPVTLEAQAGLYRSLLAGTRTLVVLDNARDAEQVRPLLPASPGCVVVVTSRNRLSDLVAAEGAWSLTLDLLAPEEARGLLAERLGGERMAADPDAATEIIRRCAGLPLALAMVAAWAANHPRFPLAVLADQLRHAQGDLDGFAGTGVTTDVRTVFSWSYRALDRPAAQLFRLLGLHSGPDFSAPAAASLAGLPADRVLAPLAELVQANLIVAHVPGRYLLHDLLRAYATELAAAAVPAAGRRAAMARMLDYYLHTSLDAALQLSPHRAPITPATARPAELPGATADTDAALAWFVAEHQVLQAAVRHAAGTGFDSHSWQLAWAVSTYWDRRGRWRDELASQHAAMVAARRLPDLRGLAQTTRLLGAAHARLGEYEEAHRHLGRALELFGELEDDASRALTHAALSMVCARQHRHREMLRHAHQALDLYRASGHRAAEAGALNNLGVAYGLAGYHARALSYTEQALAQHQRSGSRRGQGAAWDTLGYAHHHLGNHREAVACFRNALEHYRASGDPFDEAEVLTHLGESYVVTGDHAAAREAWERAASLMDSVRNPDADDVRAKLRKLAAPR